MGSSAPTPAGHPHRTMLVNATAALLLGSALMVIVHECCHWIAGALIGHRSTLYAFGVEYTPPTEGGEAAFTALAGVIGSLLIGALFTSWQPFRRSNGFGHLLWLWFGFCQLQEAVTYLVITPFGAGDTAVALRGLGWPDAVGWVMAVLGVGGMFLTARMWAPHMRHAVGEDLLLARCFSFFPWLISIPVGTVLTSAQLAGAGMDVSIGEATAIMLAGVAATVFAPMGFIFFRRTTGLEHRPLRLPSVPVLAIIIFVLLEVLNLTVLMSGISIG